MLHKRIISLISLLLLTVSVVAVVNFHLMRNYLSKLQVITSQHITADGEWVYTLGDDKSGNLLLRKMTSKGTLVSFVRLRNTQNGEFFKRKIIDVYNDDVYILKYEYSMQTLEGIAVSVERINTDLGSYNTIYQEKVPSEGYVSLKMWNGVVCIGRVLDNKLELTRIQPDGSSQVELVDAISDMATFFCGNQQELVALTRNSELYLYKDEQWQILEQADQLPIVTANMDDKGNLYLLKADNPKDSALLYVDIKTGDTAHIKDFENIRSISVSSEKAMVITDAQFSLRVIGGNTAQLVHKLYAPISVVLDSENMYLLTLQCVIAVAVVAFIYLILHLRRFPLILKQALLIFPVFLLGGIVLILFLYSYQKEIYYNQAYELMRRSVLSYARDYNPGGLVASNGMVDEQQTIDLLYFSVRDNTPYVLDCSRRFRDMPSYFLQKEPEPLAIKEMFDTKSLTKYEKYSELDEGVWFCVSAPLLAEGQVVGYIEASILSAHLEGTVMQSIVMVSRAIALILSVGLGLYLVSLYLSLRMLAQLKNGAVEIEKGNYLYRTNIKSRDELGDIGAAFNRMAENVRVAVLDIEMTNKAYSRYVPSEMFAALDKDTSQNETYQLTTDFDPAPKVTDIELGDCNQIEASLLHLCTHELEEYVETDLFTFLNEFYSRVMPEIIDMNGMIERYNVGSLVAMYRSDPTFALRSAIRIFEKIQNVGVNINCTAVIAYSNVMVGIIGSDQRLTATIVSRRIYETEQIGILGKRLGCRILLTEEAKNRIDDSQYQCRLLGYISLQGQLEPIYDCFDGEFSELRYTKKDTLEAFEDAVRQYNNGEFYEARRGFIEVIKRSPLDMCAKEYLKLSDKLYKHGGTPTPLLKI